MSWKAKYAFMRRTDLLQQQRRFHAFVKRDPGREGILCVRPCARFHILSYKLLTICVYLQRALQLILMLSNELNIHFSLLTSVNCGPS